MSLVSLVNVEYCVWCQRSIIPGCEDLYEVNIGGYMAPLCKEHFDEWNAGKLTLEDTPPHMTHLPTLAHAV